MLLITFKEHVRKQYDRKFIRYHRNVLLDKFFSSKEKTLILYSRDLSLALKKYTPSHLKEYLQSENSAYRDV